VFFITFLNRRRAPHAERWSPRPVAVITHERLAIRKLTNVPALGLSVLSTAIGLFFLAAILWTLLRTARAACRSRLSTAMTPPPGAAADC